MATVASRWHHVRMHIYTWPPAWSRTEGKSVPDSKLLFYRSAAVVWTVTVFVVDTFTAFESAVAVLYVLTLLLASVTLTRRGIVALGLICGILTFVSFLVAHGQAATSSEVTRAGIAIAVAAITTGLLVRDKNGQELLLAANGELKRSEWRYRSILEQSRFSVFEQDFSKVLDLLKELRQQGVVNIASHIQTHPELHRLVCDSIRTVDANKATAELLGGSHKEDILGPISPFVFPNESSVASVLQAIWNGRPHFEGQTRIKGVDGNELVCIIALVFPTDAAGWQRVVGMLADVTERERTQKMLLEARAELARASRVAAVGALSASIAHELNQPLGAVVMNAQTCIRWLRKQPPDIEAASAAAERAVRAGVRASTMVQETRDLLTKRGALDEVVDLGALVIVVISLLEREIDEYGARLRTHVVAGAAPFIVADSTSMQQVLVNLITNALHATSASTTTQRDIDIIIDRPDATHVRLAVADNGPGIPAEVLPRIFDSFFTTKTGGMGMGLAISRLAIEACGGELIARNREEGGAMFECLFPVSQQLEATK